MSAAVEPCVLSSADQACLLGALRTLENLTPAAFAAGGDRPAREALATVLYRLGSLDPIRAYDYRLIRSEDLAAALAERLPSG